MTILKDENGRLSLKRIISFRMFWLGAVLSIVAFVLGALNFAIKEDFLIYIIGMIFGVGGFNVGGSVAEKFKKKEEDNE